MKRVVGLIILVLAIGGVLTKLTLNLVSDNSSSCIESSCIYNYYSEEEVTLELNGAESISINYASEFSDPGAKALYMGLDVSKHLQVRTDLDIYTTGTYYYEYYIELSGTEHKVSREVKVLKDYGISFELIGSKKVTLDYAGAYQEEGVLAKDSRTGADLTKLVKVKNDVDTRLAGTQYIYYHFYYNGQKHIITREIVVKEYADYSFELVNGDEEIITRSKSYFYKVEDGATAFDNLDFRDITGFITVETDFIKGIVGEYTIKYTLSYNGINTSITKKLVVI